MKGYVYVLSNPAMPGLVKIGRSENDPRIRAQQLYTTGVPAPFKVEFAWLADDHCQLEAELHEEFADFRVAGREFFLVEASRVASSICERFLNAQSSVVVTETDWARLSEMNERAAEAGLSVDELLIALSRTPTEMLARAFRDAWAQILAEGCARGGNRDAEPSSLEGDAR